MTRYTRKTRFGIVLTTFSTLFAAGVLTPADAGADPLGVGKGAVYRLDPTTTFQEGCIAPCMCPVRSLAGVRGTFELAYAGFDGLTHNYTVSDVNWAVPLSDAPVRIVGAGKYQIGSPDPATLLQHRMVLELRVRDEPPQRFDSGWVPLEQMPHISLKVAAVRDVCWATDVTLDASRVPDDQVQAYRLAAGSTYQHGCFDPCDCLLGPELPMLGTFSLLPLERNDFFTEFAVVNVDWRVPLDNTVAETIRISGAGLYHRRAEFAVQHRLSLELRVGDEPRAHFDSDLVVGAAEFPRIDVVVSKNGMFCLDTVLHVVAEPTESRVCGGIAGVPCEEGQFCKLPVGQCCCDFFGVCTPVPQGCPDVWEPVCGCDGNTYGNECYADAAGVSLAHFGPCSLPCVTDSDCPEPNQFCKFPPGTCGDASVGGFCMAVADACPRLWDPVCGCDGVTYPNECEADRVHVSVLHRGECGIGACCTDIGGSPLPVPVCTETNVDQCGVGAFQGPGTTCEPTEACCLSNTNACVELNPFCCRVFGGIPQGPGSTCVDPSGEIVCGQTCGGITGIPCDDGLFCKLPVGACCCDQFGMCTPIPDVCPDVWDPVCGCDGVTYGNQCEADAAGVSIAHFGPCGEPCISDADCPDGTQFCKFPERTCGQINSAGFCTPIPDACPTIWDPVCGCDGVTYPNECEADRAHVSVLHRGECEAVCRPTDDGMGCVDQPCSDVPEALCAATRVQLDPATNQFRVAACDCLNFNACHLELREGRPIPVGTCLDGTPCELIGRDTNHDGAEDLFTAGCRRFCGGFTGNQCADGEFCKFPEGICSDAADHSGICRPIPEACPEFYDPVCGCDGVTYGNECEADAAAVSIRHRGECESRCAASRVFADAAPSHCLGEPITVQIVLTPPAETSALGVEDAPPPDWRVEAISHDGAYDSSTHKVKWGPLFPPFPEQVSYVAIPPDGASEIQCFRGTISLDGVNRPVCGDSCLHPCCPFMAADVPQAACDVCATGGCENCPEGNCRDGHVSLCEVTSYACAWRRGCHDDIAAMTRAAFIWRNGECYCWNEPEGNWFPAPCHDDGSACCALSASPDRIADGSATARGPDGGKRAFSLRGSSGARQRKWREITVSVEMAAPVGASAAALAIEVPSGWDVTAISDGGRWDGTHRKIKWGPMFDELSRTLTFRVRHIAGRSDGASEPTQSLRGFSGTVSFDGLNQPVVFE